MWPNPQVTEEIFNRKLHFLCNGTKGIKLSEHEMSQKQSLNKNAKNLEQEWIWHVQELIFLLFPLSPIAK